MADIIAKSKYVQSSPRKLRAVAKLVKHQSVLRSIDILKFTPKKAATILNKTIRTAMYNAVNNFSLPKEGLIIKNITIDQGPTMSRFTPMARGSANAYKKRTSHITVILESHDTPGKAKKSASVTPVSKKSSTKKGAKVVKKSETTAPKGKKTEVKVQTRREKKESAKKK